MSPEQLLGREVDSRSDIFAIGVMLVEALTGARSLPNEASAAVPHSATPTLPPALRDVLRHCLAAEPDDRSESAAELVGALLPLLRAGRDSRGGSRDHARPA